MVVGGANVVVAAALSQLGKPYVWDTPLSATDPNPSSFDCSGLTMWCYAHAGIKLGHQTNVQYRQLQHRPLSEAQPGDLVFFGTLADLYHVGLYIGNSTIVEAPDYGIPVRKRLIGPDSTGIWKTVGVFPGAAATSGGAQPVSYREFFTSVLQRMGLPITDANLRALARVSIIEGTNDRWNPLNSVVPTGGSQSFNSVGVQDYGSYQNGVVGTVKLLSGSAWSNVIDALRQGNSEGGVINAFSNTYASWGSHPSFGSISDTRANQLLNTSMGNSTVSNPPPYDATKLKAPLTKTERGKIVVWLKLQMALGDITVKGIPKDPNTLPDQKLIDAYYVVWAAWKDTNAPITGPGGSIQLPDWAQSLTKALGWLTVAKHWQRIGLFVLGAIVIIFAVVEFAKDM